MKLTLASRYALHAVAYLAVQKKEVPVASRLIAQARGISDRFLLKVLKPLVSAQILVSVKGPSGGYRLARAASEISLLDVVEAVEGQIRGQAPAGKDEKYSLLSKRLDEICSQTAEQTRKFLGKIKMSELTSKEQ
jgi:Rrf2 family protein